MDKNPYQNFENYVLRTPVLPHSFFRTLTKNTIISDDSLKKACQNKIIMEAIFLASPSLYGELRRWLKGEITEAKEAKKIVYSTLKYLSRMSSRCTPFGLFAGTAVGSFGESTNIELKHFSDFQRHTRLDMNYLVALSQDLVKNENIRGQLLFYPNSSIYHIGRQLRYIEYHYVNSRRSHQMVAIDVSDYLLQVIKAAKKGASISELAQLLVTDEISTEEALAFINELVDSQFLVSELEPSVSGPEFLDQLLPVLRNISGANAIVETLESTQAKLHSLDQSLGNDVQEYSSLGESLKTLGTKFEQKFLFQTDLTVRTKHNSLNSGILTKVQSAFSLFNKISSSSQETTLSKFGKALYDRYEGRAVPLAEALDVEVGIGYMGSNNSGDVSILVDDLVVPQKELTNSKIQVSPIGVVLHQKLISATRNSEYVVQLSDKDFEGLEPKWDDLPDTVSAMIEVVTVDGDEKVVMSGVGGSSAANLLGRFCHGDAELKAHTERIIQVEYEANPDKMLAEIVHLPESRVGNVLVRPKLRKYEIPYLAKSLVPEEDQLTIDDLVVRARYDGTVSLISKKHGKEVCPRLTNAHSYANRALPIYHFLGDLQLQKKRWTGFRWDGLANEYSFLPRLEYKGVIFSEAQWTIRKKDIESLLDKEGNDKGLSEALIAWTDKFQLPQYFLLADGDHELLINSQNLTSVRVLINTVKKRSGFILREFLYSDSSIVKQSQAGYTNQIVVSFFNARKLANNKVS